MGDKREGVGETEKKRDWVRRGKMEKEYNSKEHIKERSRGQFVIR